MSRAGQNRLAGFLVFCVLISGIATYAALTEIPPLGDDPDTVIWLLNLNFILLLALVGLVAWRLVGLWSGRRRGLAGSHLHVRLVYTFSVLAAAPAIIMTVFAAFFFHFGIQTWFGERVQTAVNESQAVAEAYLEEHQQVIRADTLAMANDLGRQIRFILRDDGSFEKLVETQSLFRNLSEAIVFDAAGRIWARSGLTFALEFEAVPESARRQADRGEVAIMTGVNDDRVRALVKLDELTDTYLYVGRMVDPQVLSHVKATREASQDYADLENRYAGLQVTLTMIFVVVGLLLMLVAIWFGLILARQLVSPITVLIKAADRVRAGDLTVRVPDQDRLQEFEHLAKSFNRMTSQIQEQQSALLEANRKLDKRRRLTEAVLEGVSSGIVGVDQHGVVTLANSSAVDLLLAKADDGTKLIGQKINDLVPGIDHVLRKMPKSAHKVVQEEMRIERKDGPARTFLFRTAGDVAEEEGAYAILTFDDITDFQVAQRKAAWADVARRIAHEIKNPLTPIQLSAERLKRKYLNQISDDPEVFSECTDTIIKNVEDIGRMVSEFSEFARMPEAVLREGNIAEHIKSTMALHKHAHPGITFDFSMDKSVDKPVYFDPHQIRQAVNNLIQNAIDSIVLSETPSGQVRVYVHPREDQVIIGVIDNGPGVPKATGGASITEPYVTHKEKGTGLGLAIVKKIMDDHGGALMINPDIKMFQPPSALDRVTGAHFVLTLPFAGDQYKGGVL